MRGFIVRTIFFKELLESLRDRRTLLMMVGLPLILYPLLMVGALKLQQSQLEASEERPSKIAIWGDLPAAFQQQLKTHGKIEIAPWLDVPERMRKDLEAGRLAPPAPEEERDVAERALGQAKPDRKAAIPEPETPLLVAARSTILSRRVDAVLVAYPDLARAAEGEGLGNLSVLFDSVRPDSRKARERVAEEAAAFRKALVAQRERNRGLTPGFARAVAIHSQNVAAQERRAGLLLGTILCAMLVGVSALGGFYSAIDLTAGEKERGTMQTLLCAPLRPTEIIAGKFLAVWALSLLASIANVSSMAATVGRITTAVGEIKMTFVAYLLSLAVLVPVSFTVSALFLAIAAFAKDFKDGQNYLTPLMMTLMVPLMAAATPAVELNAWTAFVPFINIAVLIKALFLAEAKPDAVFLTLLSSAAYAMLAILFAARVFEREAVLLGGRGSFKELFQGQRSPGGTPSPGLALLLFALVLVVAFYASLLLKNAGIVATLLAVEFGFLLLPVLALTGAFGFSFRKTLALRLPPWRGLAAAVLLGFSAWTVGAGILVRLLPPPESLSRALERILLLEGRPAPLWILWLLIGVTPAICEESLFRGFIQSGLRSLGKWPALLVTALLFGALHASIYRLLPTMFLGLMFGYAVWKTRSIACGIAGHALNNGLMVTLARSESLASQWGLEKMVFLPWKLTLAGAALTLIALLLLRSLPDPPKELDA